MRKKIKYWEALHTKCVVLINHKTKEYCIGFTNKNSDKYARAVAKYYNINFNDCIYYILDDFDLSIYPDECDYFLDLGTVFAGCYKYCEQVLQIKASYGYRLLNCNNPEFNTIRRMYNHIEYKDEINQMYPEEKLLFEIYLEYPKRLIKKD